MTGVFRTPPPPLRAPPRRESHRHRRLPAGKGAVEFVEAELKETLEGLARHLFGQDIQVRWGALLQCTLLPPDPVSVGEHVQQMPAAHYGSARVCKLLIPPGCCRLCASHAYSWCVSASPKVPILC